MEMLQSVLRQMALSLKPEMASPKHVGGVSSIRGGDEGDEAAPAGARSNRAMSVLGHTGIRSVPPVSHGWAAVPAMVPNFENAKLRSEKSS